MQLLISSRDEELRRKLLYVRCETDVGLFTSYFFPHYCDKRFSAMHIDMLETMSDRRRGRRHSWAGPRGHAKSTLITMVKTIHQIVYAKAWGEHLIGIIAETEPQAIVRLSEIKEELENNVKLRTVYGDFVGKHWKQKEIVTSNNIKIMIFGCQSKIRGGRHRQWRFTRIVYDDVENRKSVRSPEQRFDLKEWMEKDTMKAGIVGYTCFDFVGTVLDYDSRLNNLLKSPGWTPHHYKAVIEWPSDKANIHWTIWRAMITDLMLADREEKADAYYRAHEAAMLEGVVVLWPEMFPFVELMKILVFEGRASFETELQNNPYNPETALFQYETAARCRIDWDKDLIRRDDGRMVRLSTTRRYFYHDPAFGAKTGDFGAIVGVAVDDYGYVYVTNAWVKRKPPSEQIRASFEMAALWKPKACGLETNTGWALMAPDYEDEAKRRRKLGEYAHLPLFQNFQTGAKDERISSMEPKIDNKWIIFSEGLPAEFEDQMRQYPTHGHDDGPDALEGVIHVCRKYEANLFGGMDRRNKAA